MRLRYIILCFFFLFSCNARGNDTPSFYKNEKNIENDSSNIYRIIKIDSTDSIYIILAQRDKSIYKIISFKDSSECSIRIDLGKSYKLELKSVFPDNYFQKDRIHFVRYGSVNVPLGGEKGEVWDIFSVQDLKGLCLSSRLSCFNNK